MSSKCRFAIAAFMSGVSIFFCMNVGAQTHSTVQPSAELLMMCTRNATSAVGTSLSRRRSVTLI
jgi:hypothetical protein